MYHSVVRQALVRQPLVLGLERRAMIFGVMGTIGPAATWSLIGMIWAFAFAFAYWGVMLRFAERDSQFLSIWLRSIGMSDEYRSFGQKR